MTMPDFDEIMKHIVSVPKPKLTDLVSKEPKPFDVLSIREEEE